MDDPELDEIIRNLPADYEERIIAEKREQDAVDEIIKNLPPDFDSIAVKRKAEDGDNTANPKRNRRKEPCPTCGKEIDTRNMTKHRRLHSTTCYDCVFCGYKGGKSLEYMRNHYRRFHSNENHKCRRCGEQFASESAFFEEPHVSSCIKCLGNENQPLQPLPVEDIPIFFQDPQQQPELTEPFWQDPIMRPYADEETVVALIRHHWRDFRQRFDTDSPLVQEFYYRTTGTDVADFTMTNAMRHVYTMSKNALNFNIGMTTLLKRETQAGDEFKIFIAQNNRQNIFDHNILIHDLASLETACAKINSLGEITEYAERLGSDWKVVAVLGLVWYVYLRPNYVAGKGSSHLPTYLTYNKKTIENFCKNPRNNNLYEDNHCLWRCILRGALKGDPHDLNAVTETYEVYRKRVNGPHWKHFPGVPEEHLPLIEELFQINIQIYRKTSPNNITCLRKAAANANRQTINVHSCPIDATKVHFSLILNLHNFAGKHHCAECGRMFKMKQHLQKHQRVNCHNGETQFTYKDGCYEPALTIFERMLEFGIFVEPERRKCDSYIAWDMEACLEPLQLDYQRNETAIATDEHIEQRLNKQNIQVEYVNEAKLLQLRERHVAVTNSIVSTVQGYTDTQFFYNSDPDLLLKDVFNAMVEISDKNYELECLKFANEFAQIANLQQEAEAGVQNASEDDKPREKAALKKIQRLKSNLDRYCRTCTVLSFNGGRYDLLLCKAHLMPRLTAKARQVRNEGTDGEEAGAARSWPKAITRGSTILCLVTEELRFIDIVLYCPGTNLDKFIKTFNSNGEFKGYFPYEILRRYEDLHTIMEFPPKSAFYSTLKNGGISQKEYDDAKSVWNSLPEPRSLLAYIKWYNTRDVEPFLTACKNMHSIFWNDFGIDIFRQAQSLPGVCLAFLFKRLQQVHPTASFGLFNETQANLCQELYSSMTGGLAVIVNRLAEKDKTPIRGNPEVLTQKILGLDFNALYLWAMCQDTPAGHADHWALNEDGSGFERKSETMEEKLKRRKTHGEVHFLKYAAFRDNVYIHHAEHGKQTTLLTKQYRVDGLAKDAKPKPRVYEYHGCFYHCHESGCLNKKLDLTNANRSRMDYDVKKMKELTEAGFDVKVTWECDFKAVKDLARALRKGRSVREADPNLLQEAKTYNAFLKKHPLRTFYGRRETRYQEMFNAIIKGDVFGFAKVDVKTPDHLRDALSDFPPIIKHADITIDDIGEYMKQIAQQMGQLDKPRRCLINSYFANSTWIMSPLIQFYHEHGIEIVKIHEVAQFEKGKMFEWFGQTVTEHRKLGDADPDKAILGTIYKLLGNSAYGKTITNLTKHMNVFYTDAAEIQRLHNDPYHHRTIKITDNCYEIHKRKETIEFNLPMQIGLSVYAWAKLRVLSFIYDVLQVFVSPSCYDFLESDTDSIYLAISRNSLRACIPRDKLPAFERVEPLWFVMDNSQLRTPGLLKVEVEGIAFIGLSAKTYFVLKEGGQGKHSAKGVQLRNSDILTYNNYRNILLGTDGDSIAFNIGIRPIKNVLYTYIQCKTGLSRLYVKRICLPNHRALPLEL